MDDFKLLLPKLTLRWVLLVGIILLGLMILRGGPSMVVSKSTKVSYQMNHFPELN